MALKGERRSLYRMQMELHLDRFEKEGGRMSAKKDDLSRKTERKGGPKK